jgi:hypothetical protein
MKMNLVTHYSYRHIALLLLVCGLLVAGCSKSKAPVVETAPTYQPPPPPVVQVPTNVVPAKLNDVEEALNRVFKGAAVVDKTMPHSFYAGDFNGDAIQDIAIAVKPAPGKIETLNEEYPSWLLRDPFAAEETRSPSLRVTEDESLLAIIHGYGANDWRDPQATQTFLLKNIVGSEVEVHAGKQFVKANRGKKLPPIRGDVIGQMLRGNRGYIYFAAATYRWFDPATYKGERPRGPFHRAMGRKS